VQKDFRGVIWTNHALQKLRERGIKQGDAWVTWRRPDQSRPGKIKGTWIYYKTFPTSSRLQGRSANQKIEVVAKKNERGQWIILSVWSKPIFGKRGEKTESLWKIVIKRIFVKKKKKGGGEIL
jgi:hypothetical protein